MLGCVFVCAVKSWYRPNSCHNRQLLLHAPVYARISLVKFWICYENNRAGSAIQFDSNGWAESSCIVSHEKYVFQRVIACIHTLRVVFSTCRLYGVTTLLRYSIGVCKSCVFKSSLLPKQSNHVRNHVHSCTCSRSGCSILLNEIIHREKIE